MGHPDPVRRKFQSMVCKYCMVFAEITLLTLDIFLGLMYGLLPPYNYVRFSTLFLESSRGMFSSMLQATMSRCYPLVVRLNSNQVSVQREE